jgi:hypothetical protein
VLLDAFIALFFGTIAGGLASIATRSRGFRLCLAVGALVAATIFFLFMTECPTGMDERGRMVCLPEPYLDGTETSLERYRKRLQQPERWRLVP